MEKHEPSENQQLPALMIEVSAEQKSLKERLVQLEKGETRTFRLILVALPIVVSGSLTVVLASAF